MSYTFGVSTKNDLNVRDLVAAAISSKISEKPIKTECRDNMRRQM
jgi:hypothetical protein